jgi:hypothetical protein
MHVQPEEMSLGVRSDFPSRTRAQDELLKKIVQSDLGQALGSVYSALIPSSLMSGHHFCALSIISVPSACGVCW